MSIQSMDSAPKDGTYILLFGDSGYTTTPYRCEVCRYDAEYRPLQPWVNHANDSFLDGGDEPIGWMPLPKIATVKSVACGSYKEEDVKVPKLREAEAMDLKQEEQQYDFDISSAEAAKELGLVVVTPLPNELFIDIDTPEQFLTYKRRIRELRAYLRIRTSMHPSKKGLPHRHIYVSLYDGNGPFNLDDWQRICLQFLLASDPVRETLSVYRILSGVKGPTRFFEACLRSNDYLGIDKTLQNIIDGEQVDSDVIAEGYDGDSI